MKAWLLDATTGLDQLRLADVTDPIAGPGQVLMQVEFAALNPADRYLAEGQYPARSALPHVLGRDGVGTVISVGQGVSDASIGDRRAILRGETGVSCWGTFAGKVAVTADSLVQAPPSWSVPQAGSAALVYLTAHQALCQWGQLPPSVVLVTGASGGVGVACLHLGQAMGHTMVALSRGSSKRDALTAQGAAAVFDPTDSSWKKQIRQYLGGRRVDLAVDNIGGALFSDVLDTLGDWGKVSVVGRLAGPVPEFNTAGLFFRRLRIGGVAVGTYSHAESRANWLSIVAALNEAHRKPLIDSIFPFDALPAAFARLKEGPLGKVILQAPPD